MLKDWDTSYTPYTALDGQVAAYVDGGEYLVTSPNSSNIYQPLLGPRTVSLRKDYRLGPDDPLLYPQPFIPLRCHWAAIPRQPRDKADRLQKWWDEPPLWAFVEEADSAIQGMGQWTAIYVDDFAKDCYILHEKVALYLASLKSQGKQGNAVVLALDRQLLQTLRHIQSISLPRHVARQLWSFFQRWYLELVGALDWIELYQPVMEGRKAVSISSSTKAASAMGAFVYSVADCEFLFQANLPFWYVRSSKHQNTKRLDAMVDPITPESLRMTMDDLVSPTRQVIYEGPSADIRKAASIEKFGLTILDVGGNPFAVADPASVPASVPASASEPSTSQPTASSSRPSRTKKKHPPRDPYQKSKRPPARQPQVERDKFSEIRGPFSPDIPDVWVEALQAVDRSRRPKKSDVPNGGYCFPDPGMILFAPPEKRARLLRKWLQYRSVLVFRHTMQDSNIASRAWSPRQWQLLLAMTDDHPSKEGSFVAQERAVVQELLGRCLTHYGLTHVQTQTDQNSFTWRKESRPVTHLSDPQQVREIVWELFELNFRFEFLALDCKHSGTYVIRPELLRCFAGTPTAGDFTHMDFQSAHCGPAAREAKERDAYLIKMCEVFGSWPEGGTAGKLLNGRTEVGQFSELELKELERWATRFYCQTFYENFGRPPILPHALFKP
ncbi:hypothetical protein PM082_023322 [Marasmius tenuissimus]|nr:hypothetical protein PM082_023322 [Marasmius tenuissimus]